MTLDVKARLLSGLVDIFAVLVCALAAGSAVRAVLEVVLGVPDGAAALVSALPTWLISWHGGRWVYVQFTHTPPRALAKWLFGIKE